MALHCTGNYKNYDEAYYAAVESLESGRAKEVLNKLIELQDS
jgi:anthranilate phosphoribosyltransferase